MNGKTPISALQELMAARGHHLPKYVEEGSETQFKCTVYVEDIKAVGYGMSKKSAKHESAKNALEKLQVHSQQIVKRAVVLEKPLKNFVGELNEYSSKNGLQYPDYQFLTATVDGHFIYKCTFVGNKVSGSGANKKEAKQDAAKNMLALVDNRKPINYSSKFKIINEQTTFEIKEVSGIISMFKNLTAHKEHFSQPTTVKIEPAPEIDIAEEDNVEDLEKQLRAYGIKYTVTDFQRNPYVVCLIIKNTHFTFLAADSYRKEALKKVYRNVLEVKRSGCSLNSDLFKFE